MQALLTLVFMMSGDIVALIEFASFLIWTFYGFAFVALIVLRKTQPDTHRPYKVCGRSADNLLTNVRRTSESFRFILFGKNWYKWTP